jgi:hypothetical protein
MIVFAMHELPSIVAQEMYRRAKHSFFSGTDTPDDKKLINHCTAQHSATGTIIIFTRDIGYHTSGWWKNPDYERCWHLSLSFREPLSGSILPKDEQISKLWLDAFFSLEDQKKIWVEPPHYSNGKTNDVWHYRLFCDKHWLPLLPRKEVYTTEFTEKGWKSFSEVQASVKG